MVLQCKPVELLELEQAGMQRLLAEAVVGISWPILIHGVGHQAGAVAGVPGL